MNCQLLKLHKCLNLMFLVVRSAYNQRDKIKCMFSCETTEGANSDSISSFISKLGITENGYKIITEMVSLFKIVEQSLEVWGKNTKKGQETFNN